MTNFFLIVIIMNYTRVLLSKNLFFVIRDFQQLKTQKKKKMQFLKTSVWVSIDINI